MSASFTHTQQANVERARALAAISSGDDEAIAAHIGHADLTTVYAAAYAEAKHTIDDLLRIIDDLTGGAR
jgi:hypothetical protein